MPLHNRCRHSFQPEKESPKRRVVTLGHSQLLGLQQMGVCPPFLKIGRNQFFLAFFLLFSRFCRADLGWFLNYVLPQLSQRISPRIFSALFLQGFSPPLPQIFTPKIVGPPLQFFEPTFVRAGFLLIVEINFCIFTLLRRVRRAPWNPGDRGKRPFSLDILRFAYAPISETPMLPVT